MASNKCSDEEVTQFALDIVKSILDNKERQSVTYEKETIIVKLGSALNEKARELFIEGLAASGTLERWEKSRFCQGSCSLQKIGFLSKT